MANNRRIPFAIGLLIGGIALILISIIVSPVFRQPASPEGTFSPIVSPNGDQTPSPTRIIAEPPTSSPTPIPVTLSEDGVLIIRTLPAERYPVLAEVESGALLNFIGRYVDNNWLLVVLPDGRRGWIWKDDVVLDFDINILPVIDPFVTPTPSQTVTATPKAPGADPYGGSMLVPPSLTGVSPTTQYNPYRGILSLFSILSLAVLITITWGSLHKIPREPILKPTSSIVDIAREG